MAFVNVRGSREGQSTVKTQMRADLGETLSGEREQMESGHCKRNALGGD